MKRPPRLLLATALTLAAPPLLANNLQATVDDVIPALMREQGIAGMAVAVYANGQSHYFNYGLADKASRQPVSRDTLFEVGSVSKTYTATLAALASAEGKLDLQAPASRYQPALAKASIGKASVLELGTYSGDCLPLQFPDEVQTPAQTLAWFQHWQPRFAPGTHRCYSNPSLGLFGDLAARAQQQPFAELMTQQVLPRLGLKHTYLEVPASARGLYAQGYDAKDQPVRVNPGPYAEQAYGIKTSASDLLHYVQLQLQPDTLDPAMRKAIAITQSGYFQVGAMIQGLGWERYPYPVSLDTLLEYNGAKIIRGENPIQALTPALPADPGAWYNKTGATGGFGAYVAFVPSRQMGIVLLANRNYPNEERVRAAQRILSSLEP
ncbi:beta-lactamase [Pseudomonas mosselii]|uniref:class C beta-lactamase n=1 Tax=Pseudomonas mosselii TaxID=78327 RepID=UPI001647B505|nr:class C beta-lactamase [Pseudomonas mosselii]MBC3450276.1 beta-lactamase [Pseudomonas mosselii]MDH1659528.1 beta-lactamase [Pseudomonas mosselii]MDH1719292.1 beta-lactamase [Pseudomonas mosselii]MDH1723466.1 beta-lactamase [Pseudomonas mosselii]MDN4498391.1 class C beta-lactamase [Pseudomonas mosselii]